MAKTLTPQAQRLKDLIDFDKRVYFLILVSLYLLIRYLTNSFIIESIPDADRLESDGSLMIFHIFNALNYLWTPFALLWKFTVISFLFWLGAFMLGYKVPYRELWQFALIAEIVFVFPELIRLLVFLNPATGTTYLEIQEYRTLSLLSLIGPNHVSGQYHYVLATINVFEIIYGIVWLFGFNLISRRPFGECAWVVAVSYFLPLVIWLSWFVMVYRG
jgi:hypothetical protein